MRRALGARTSCSKARRLHDEARARLPARRAMRVSSTVCICEEPVPIREISHPREQSPGSSCPSGVGALGVSGIQREVIGPDGAERP